MNIKCQRFVNVLLFNCFDIVIFLKKHNRIETILFTSIDLQTNTNYTIIQQNIGFSKSIKLRLMMSDTINKQWHLASSQEEILLTEFELYLWRTFYGFLRWQEDCENSINPFNLTGEDLAVLHLIRMKDRPKTIMDVGRLMNREDYHNIKYSVRKLQKFKLIKSIKGVNKKTIEYEATEAGRKDTEAYTKIRKEALVGKFKNKNIDFAKAIETLNQMKAIYDEASRMVFFYKNNPQKN